MLAWSSDGTRVAGATRGGGSSSIWVMDADGATLEEAASGTRLSFPAWAPDGSLACLSLDGDHQHLYFPCGSAEPFFEDQEVFGRLVFAVDGSELPHPGCQYECSGTLYVRECTSCTATIINYCNADQLEPELERVWDWFDDVLPTEPGINLPRNFCRP